jgi:peptide/nickel transport system substrate-binding protein
VGRTRGLAVAAVVVAAAALAGCGGSGDSGALTVLNAGRTDVNPVDDEDVDAGGELRWPYDRLPLTFNYFQVNGSDDEDVAVIGALLPRMFVTAGDGSTRANPDYVVSADLVAKSPQTVRYVLNPAARWSNGAPITWKDFEAQWKALNGSNPAFQSGGADGYDDIASVARGADDHQVLVTFQRKFAEWQGLFSPLYPASDYATPAAFNGNWLGAIPVTAGPFVVQAVDKATGQVTVARNDAWWGTKAKLDRIVFKPYDPPNYFEGLATNDLDFAPVRDDANLVRQARTLPDFVIRQSVGRRYTELLLNGAPNLPLADQAVRQALALGLDRQAIAKRALGEINPAIRPTGNFVLPMGDSGYRDNSGPLAFDPAAAGRALDAAGWRAGADNRRAKAGRPLALRLVVLKGDPASEAAGAAIAQQLAAIGVTATAQPLDATAKDVAMRTGAFDLILTDQELSASPLSTEVRRYYEPEGADVGSNFGRVYNEEIVNQFNDALGDLDERQRNADINGLDTLIWSVLPGVPLYPEPGAYAVRSSLQNFGAPGLSDVDYAAIGLGS